ncbi:hypothetical protein E2C01_061645 [Portunus trituberculatus]|uniref:Uncharacterized protein n=1 Tax=Portunus trituberculatus TaxID=210409 RepID=A0A5B7HEZ6_PORTR|nr:hypothetical protein [Portunus trituberculatus]
MKTDEEEHGSITEYGPTKSFTPGNSHSSPRFPLCSLRRPYQTQRNPLATCERGAERGGARREKQRRFRSNELDRTLPHGATSLPCIPLTTFPSSLLSPPCLPLPVRVLTCTGWR